MQERLSTTYRFQAIHIHWLSLDVVAGAVVSHLVANRMPAGKTPVNAWVAIILGLVVLGVYTLDHLLDNHRPEQPRTQRHAFIKKYEYVVWRITIGALVLAGALSWLIPRELWEFGAAMVVVAGLYLWGVSRIPLKSDRQALKEPITSFIYASGVWGSTWFLGNAVTWESIVLGIVFYLLTFQSLLLFSHFEAIRYKDVYNLARWLQRPLTLKFLKIITITTVITCLVVVFLTDFRFAQRVSVFLLLMSLIHYWMLSNPDKVVLDERFRILGEVVFLLPGLAL